MTKTTIDSSQSAPQQALVLLFGSAARVAVLRVFLIDPMRAYYQRQLEEATGRPLRAIQRELDRLTALGLLYRRSEGNRTYYRVDMEFPMYGELRAMLLKGLGPVDALRAELSVDDAVRLMFLSREGDRVLVVTRPGKRVGVRLQGALPVEWMTSEEFLRGLHDKEGLLASYLIGGTDALGRREDVIWRHIETAGYSVTKGEGVP